MESRISKINIFRARRGIFTHTIPYVFINLLILTAWIDPQPGRLNSGLGVITVTLVWTPIFMIHLVRHCLLEIEYRALKSFGENVYTATNYDVLFDKRKREELPIFDSVYRQCDESRTLQANGFVLCLSNKRLTTPYAGTITLTKTECHLMQLLMEHSEHPVPIDYIYREVWGYEAQDISALKNTIYRLRKKIEVTPGEPRHLVFIPDEGYAFLSDLG